MARPGRKPGLLQVRTHLTDLQLALDLFQRHGDCPIVREAFARVSLLNRAILRADDERRAAGDRKGPRL